MHRSAQAEQARRVIPMAEAPPPRGDGLYGTEVPRRAARRMVDARRLVGGRLRRAPPRETPGALLATGVSRRLQRPVRLHRYAVVGAHVRRPALSGRRRAGAHEPDLAVILIGGNDVTHRTPRARRRAAPRSTRCARLRAAGAEVVVGTCPDLGAIQPIQPPLRWLARRWSRQLAAAQTVAVVEAGGRTVSLGDLLGPRFAAEPARMFGRDRFHPSAEGYALAAAAMLPTVLAALGAPTDRRPADRAARACASLPQAAQEAARSAGTEVSGTQVGGPRPRPGRPLGAAAPSPGRVVRARSGGARACSGARRDRRRPYPRSIRSDAVDGASRTEWSEAAMTIDAVLAGRLGRAAAITLLAGAVGGAALLAGEALAARARRYAQPDLGLALRTVGGPPQAPPLRLVLLGDSAALGVGVDGVADTVGGQLARLLAEGAAGRARYDLSSVGVSGSRSTDLATQVARALLGDRPDVAVVADRRQRRDRAAPARRGRRPTSRRRAPAARRRRRGGRRHLPRPGRRARDRPAAAAGRRLVGPPDGARAGRRRARRRRRRGRPRPRETGAVFRADAGTLCYDGFHPSADGYRVWAHALLPGGRRGRGDRPPAAGVTHD